MADRENPLPGVPEGAHIELPLTPGDMFDLGWMGEVVTVVVDEVAAAGYGSSPEHVVSSPAVRPAVTIRGHVLTQAERLIWDGERARD